MKTQPVLSAPNGFSTIPTTALIGSGPHHRRQDSSVGKVDVISAIV